MEFQLGLSTFQRGSVVVTAGGRVLIEGIDYSGELSIGKGSNFRCIASSFEHTH